MKSLTKATMVVLFASLVFVVPANAKNGIKRYSCEYVEDRIDWIRDEQRKGNSASRADKLTAALKKFKKHSKSCW